MRQVKAQHFIALWTEAYKRGETISWISERMNKSKATVSQMAYQLRNAGIDLPTLKRPHVETLDIDDLNWLIKKQLEDC